jgi:hypothetical protein
MMTMLSLFVALVAVSLSLLPNSAAAPSIAISTDDIASCMKAQPYVEESCQASSFPGWPYDAKDCSYKTPIGTLYVTVADAPAERVAAWVLNATLTVPWTADLQSAHPGAFLQVQKILAVDVMYQRCAVKFANSQLPIALKLRPIVLRVDVFVPHSVAAAAFLHSKATSAKTWTASR